MDEWKLLPACPNYRAFRDGRIESCLTRGRKGGPTDRWRPIRPRADRLGYEHFTVALGRVGSKICYQVHRAVLEAFVGPCPPGMQCRHLDGNPRNNHLDNLRWGTPAENTVDKANHGMIPSGEKHWHTKLTEDDVRLMRRLKALGVTYPQLAAKFGMSTTGCYLIVSRRLWSHVA